MVTARSAGKNARRILCGCLLSQAGAAGLLAMLAIAADPPWPPRIARVEPPNCWVGLKSGPLLVAGELQVYSVQ